MLWNMFIVTMIIAIVLLIIIWSYVACHTLLPKARGKKRQVGWFPASHVKLLVKSTEPTVTNEQQPDHDVDDDVYAVPQKRENPAGNK